MLVRETALQWRVITLYQAKSTETPQYNSKEMKEKDV